MVLRLKQYLEQFISIYFHSIPGGYTARKISLLKQFYTLTNSYPRDLEIDYWLAYGTLLGYYREKGLLAHGIDLDYGAPEESFGKIWDNRHQLPRGLKLFNTSHRHKGPKLFFSYKGFDADIYFYGKKGNKMVPYLISSIPADMKAFPVDYIYPLVDRLFLGQTTFAPAKPKDYLKHCYRYIGRHAVFDPKSGYWYEKKSDAQGAKG